METSPLGPLFRVYILKQASKIKIVGFECCRNGKITFCVHDSNKTASSLSEISHKILKIYIGQIFNIVVGGMRPAANCHVSQSAKHNKIFRCKISNVDWTCVVVVVGFVASGQTKRHSYHHHPGSWASYTQLDCDGSRDLNGIKVQRIIIFINARCSYKHHNEFAHAPFWWITL